MKHIFILLICMLPFIQLHAQQFTGGGMGYFTGGPALVLTSEVDDYLATSDVLGTSYDPSPLAMMYGGEGFWIMNKFLFGGGGYGMSQFTQSSDSGSVLQSGGGGYFKAGYMVWSRGHSFMTLNTGFGGFGYNYEITNKTEFSSTRNSLYG